MEIIGKAFSPEEFAAYVKELKLGSVGWKPAFCVRHNTGSPTLAQRPQGFTAQHMVNLKDYYQNTMKWHAGPHLFIDDHKIWVFSPLLHPGVHTPSWNDVSLGIEQLGDYNKEAYSTGRGLAVQKNTIAAIAVLSHFGGIDSATMKDHLEDVRTTHRDCPGKSCHDTKAAFIKSVHQYIVDNLN